jgi:RNA polymerase sigma-70 factor (ECF subfamily)
MNETMPDFQQIYITFQPKIFGYLSRLAGQEDAEDLCQETFLKVEQGLSGFRGEAQLSTWIYQIASHVFHDRLRSRSFKQQQCEQPSDLDDDLLEDHAPLSQDPKPQIDQQIIRAEMNSCIRSYIDQLPELYREVLLLSEAEGFKNREIAKILQISLDNVKVRLHRARGRLKESLQNHCDFYLDERSEIACDRKQRNDCDR